MNTPDSLDYLLAEQPQPVLVLHGEWQNDIARAAFLASGYPNHAAALERSVDVQRRALEGHSGPADIMTVYAPEVVGTMRRILLGCLEAQAADDAPTLPAGEGIRDPDGVELEFYTPALLARCLLEILSQESHISTYMSGSQNRRLVSHLLGDADARVRADVPITSK